MTTDDFQNDPTGWNPKEREMAQEMTPEQMNDVYREIAETAGVAAAVKIWKHFGGLTVTFPQRICPREYAGKYIGSHMDTEKPREMAAELDLSGRRIRQLIQIIRKEKKEGGRKDGNR